MVGQEEDKKLHPELVEFIQTKREVQCAVNLVQKLEQYVSGDISGFEATTNEEAQELSRTPLGSVLLTLIGTVYMEQGRAELGGLSGLSVNISQTNRYIGTRFNLVNKGFAAASTVNEAQKLTQRLEEIKKAKQAEGSTVETEEEKEINAKLKKATLPIMSVMWSLTTIDIESTLQKVCTKVTHDNSISPESRLLRKRGLVRLGEIYYQKGQETIPKGGIEDILVQTQSQILKQQPDESAT